MSMRRPNKQERIAAGVSAAAFGLQLVVHYWPETSGVLIIPCLLLVFIALGLSIFARGAL